MAQCAGALCIPEHAISAGEVFVACGDGDIVGVARFEEPSAGDAELTFLYVEPAWIGRGIGARLFDRVVEEATRTGCASFGILADPHAALFYESRGCVFEAMRPSDAIPGRELPYYRHVVRAL